MVGTDTQVWVCSLLDNVWASPSPENYEGSLDFRNVAVAHWAQGVAHGGNNHRLSSLLGILRGIMVVAMGIMEALIFCHFCYRSLD
jgi:hypothetical protein